VFGPRLQLARRYADLLAVEGERRGLLGPREVPRLWSRHLVNSAAITDLIPAPGRIVDVGSGAGLPGIPVAIRRPDLVVDLVEPMLRRTAFLTEAVAGLGLQDTVRVVRGRAEDGSVVDEVGRADWVTARAVAPLDRLVKWCLPLVVPGGSVLALKGSSAEAEVEEHRSALLRTGADQISIHTVAFDGVEPVRVVMVRRARGRSAAGLRSEA
jgi:16S rRNA (guanine527-N7)-methyltransferase